MRSSFAAAFMGIGGIFVSFAVVVFILELFTRRTDAVHQLPTMSALGVKPRTWPVPLLTPRPFAVPAMISASTRRGDVPSAARTVVAGDNVVTGSDTVLKMLGVLLGQERVRPERSRRTLGWGLSAG